ncbi:hypothetical protein PHMEG_00039560 [Phytophthora megakarya]|uniref:Uncharacterized protein n=1 Tax=Phytophthora megakarya TaxID=4795 RepID=A0A225UI07_9STRA|nr:hypothetical protein PHMEG_00039560 [Phytophthora megakarya]
MTPDARVVASPRSVTEERLNTDDSGESEPKKADCDVTQSYERLFTPVELNLLQEGLSIGADHEPEEYDKELEERLYPLDEVELKRRMKQNAERLKSLTLEEMSTLLNLPVDVLERTREASPGELSTPEYWLAWYKKTLADAEEAMPTVIFVKVSLVRMPGLP